jgi:hypothetical protein
MNPNKKSAKNAAEYTCAVCTFRCSKKSDWSRHLSTRKHLILTNPNDFTPKNATFVCECGKRYKHSSSLCAHKKKCFHLSDDENTYQGINIHDRDALVMHLLKQNSDLHNKIMNMSSMASTTNTNIHATTTNIQNKTFNLNLFLNETCKDAMNITDFVSSIKVNLDDLENTGRCGYIEGITDIIVKNLNDLEQHMRPLHCSDFKREVLYIKENNEWFKEEPGCPILTKTIRTIANENMKQINKWRENYPDCTQADSSKNDLYLKIVSNSMNGLTEEEGRRNINKIITNVARKVVIAK